MFTKLGNQWVRHTDFEVSVIDKDFMLYREGNHSVKIYKEAAFEPYRLSISLSEIKFWDEPYSSVAITDNEKEQMRINIEAAWAFLDTPTEFV